MQVEVKTIIVYLDDFCEEIVSYSWKLSSSIISRYTVYMPTLYKFYDGIFMGSEDKLTDFSIYQLHGAVIDMPVGYFIRIQHYLTGDFSEFSRNFRVWCMR